MGFVLSKFRKTKPSIKDSLEKIEKEIRGIHRFQIDTEVQQKRIIGRLVLISMVVFFIAAIGVYFFAPAGLSITEKALYLSPFFVFPVIIWSLKGFLNWWYQRKIVMNKEKLETLKKDKDQLLEDVMEKETFKVAKEILEKYAPSRLLPKYLAEQQRHSPQGPGMNTPLTSRTRMSTGNIDEGLRRRAMATPMGAFPQRAIGPGAGRYSMGPVGQPQQGPYPRPQFRPTGPPAIMGGPSSGGFRGPSPAFSSVPTGFTPMRQIMPAAPANPVLVNRRTGWMDKLVDYVVGDGPANRYALVCRYCATHNGLATPEDFPYIGYRCVYCRQFNPPRQQRPSAQTLPRNTVLIEEMETTIKSEDGSILTDTESKENDENTIPESEGEGDGLEEGKQSDDASGSGDRTCNEPVVELPGSTSDLSRRSDSEQEKEDDNIPFADDGNEEQQNESGGDSSNINAIKEVLDSENLLSSEEEDGREESPTIDSDTKMTSGSES